MTGLLIVLAGAGMMLCMMPFILGIVRGLKAIKELNDDIVGTREYGADYVGWKHGFENNKRNFK